MNKLDLSKLLKDIENGNENPLVWEEYHAILNNILAGDIETNNSIKGYIIDEQHYFHYYDEAILFLPKTLKQSLGENLLSTDIVIITNNYNKFIPLMVVKESEYNAELYFNNDSSLSHDYCEFNSFNDALTKIKSWQECNDCNIYINSFVGCYFRNNGLHFDKEIYEKIANYDEIIFKRLNYEMIDVFLNSNIEHPSKSLLNTFSLEYMNEFVDFLQNDI